MAKLLVGFDSAWTAGNSGAVVGTLRSEDGSYFELGVPKVANYLEAENLIRGWQMQYAPSATVVMLDQPTVVRNASGQRPVEQLVSSPVGKRYGGVQPANTGKLAMFGKDAPVWAFLDAFGGQANPRNLLSGTWVLETYPVLTIIALDWLLPDKRPTGRLPKYNPERRATFSVADWKYVCQQASSAFSERGAGWLGGWLGDVRDVGIPSKSTQDRVDACLCLLVAMYLVEGNECLQIGNLTTGCIVVPHGGGLLEDLKARCQQLRLDDAEWIHQFRLPAIGRAA